MYELSSRPCCVLSMTCLNNFRRVVIHQSNWIGLVGKIEAGNHGFSHEILGVPLNFPTKTNRMSASGCLCPKSTLKLCEASWDFVGPSSNRQLTWISRGIGTEKLLLYIYIYVYSSTKIEKSTYPNKIKPTFFAPLFLQVKSCSAPPGCKDPRCPPVSRWDWRDTSQGEEILEQLLGVVGLWCFMVFYKENDGTWSLNPWDFHGFGVPFANKVILFTLWQSNMAIGNPVWMEVFFAEMSKNCGRNVCFSATNQYRPKVVQQIWTRKTNWKKELFTLMSLFKRLQK